MCCESCCTAEYDDLDTYRLDDAQNAAGAALAELEDFYDLTGRILAYLGIQDFRVEPSPASLAAVAKFLGMP